MAQGGRAAGRAGAEELDGVWAEAKTRSGCEKPFVSANSRLFENDLLQFNSDLPTMMRIEDHHNEFTPKDRDELSRQRQLAPLKTQLFGHQWAGWDSPIAGELLSIPQ